MGKRTTDAVIAALPFVKNLAPGKGRDWWAVQGTGDYLADTRRGEDYAIALLEYELAHENSHPVLGSIIEAMITKGADDATHGLRGGFAYMTSLLQRQRTTSAGLPLIRQGLAEYRVKSDATMARLLKEEEAEEAAKARKRRLRRVALPKAA